MVESNLKPTIVRALAAGRAMTGEELRMAIGAPSASYVRLLCREMADDGILEIGHRRSEPGKPFVYRLRVGADLSAA